MDWSMYRCMLVAFAVFAVCRCQEIDVMIYDGNGQPLSTDESYEFREGEEIICTYIILDGEEQENGGVGTDKDEDGGTDSLIFFTWQKIPNIIGHVLDGPVTVNLPVNRPITNRLVISNPLGFGEPTGYRCIASNNFDPTNPDPGEFAGRPVYFRVIPRLPAGVLFPERDYVQSVGRTIDLACIRNATNGTVVWETINQMGESRVALIYDSTDPQPLPDNYVFLFNDEDENDFTLRITMQDNDMAITHVCTITDPTEEYARARSEAMLFAANVNGGGCTSDPSDLVDLEIGDDVTFSGCDVTIGIASQSGLTYDDFTTMTLWTHLTPEGVLLRDFDDTRVFDEASTFVTTVAPEFDNTVIGCAVQVHREEVSVVMARVDDICEDQLLVDVADTATRFRIYYGDRSEMDYNDFISFGTFNRYKADVQTGGSLTCELDAIPEPAAGSVKMQTQSPGEHEWVTDDDNIIEQAEIVSGAVYRCIYEDQPDVISGGVHMTAGVVSTIIYNSRGEQLNEDEVYDINGGDYLECRPNEPVSNYYPPQYVWQIDLVAGSNQGPVLVRRQNGQGFINRLYIDHELGRGEVIGYRCIGTDDLSQAVIGMIGTLVKFRVVDVPAGSVFGAGDHAVEVGETLDLTCARAAADVRVMWETVNLAGDVIATLYDSQSPGSLPTGYEFIDLDPEQSNDFSVRIIVSLDTAISTRCSLQPEGITRSYTAVSQTTLIFAVDQVEECFITDEETIDAGEKVRLRGCDASIVVSDQSGVIDADYQAIMHWAVSPEGSDEFTIIEESRVFDAESIHEETALTEVDGNSYQCGIQISRPNAITNSATIANLCDVDVTLHVTDNSVNFRIYYGDITDENMLTLGPYTTYVGNENNKDMTCEIDRHPPPISGSTIQMQTRASPNDDWENTNSETVLADDIITGHQYRCQYFDGSNDRESSPISMVDGINDVYTVEIVNSAGEVLNDQEVYDFTAGDFVTCRPADGSVFRLQYMWTQALFGERPEGPTIIQIPTDEFGQNRLYMSTSFGEGEETGYRCVGADNIQELSSPGGFMGTLLKFRVFPGGTLEPAGVAPPEADQAAVAGVYVEIPCSKNTDTARLLWETVTSTGTRTLLYDSIDSDEDDLPDGYEVIIDGNNIHLEVAVSNATATLHRCTVSESGRATVSAEVMVFSVEPQPCSSPGLGDTNMLGDDVTFSGCHGNTFVSDVSGFTAEDYDAVVYWQQSMAGSDDFSIIDETKTLSEHDSQDSVLHLTVQAEDHGTMFRCGIQVKRPESTSVAATIDNLCTNDYTINLADSELMFTLTYGPEPLPFTDDRDTAELLTVAYEDDCEISCLAEEFPLSPEATYSLHEKIAGGEWVDLQEPHAVGVEDATYRCAYNVMDMQTLSASVQLIDPVMSVPDLGIFDQEGTLLSPETVLDLTAGSHLVCKPRDGEVVGQPIRYVWQRGSPAPGPRLLLYTNEPDQSNRLLIEPWLGEGLETRYYCSASMGPSLLPEWPSSASVSFRVEDPPTGSATATQAATFLSALLAVVTVSLQQ